MSKHYPLEPQFPLYCISPEEKTIVIVFSEMEIMTNIEWHDPDDTHKDDIVFDALIRRVYLKVTLRLEIEAFKLINTLPTQSDGVFFVQSLREFRIL
jgi:hypothetical protein